MKYVFVIALMLAACGRVVEVAPEIKQTKAESICSPQNEICFDVAWKATPTASQDNQLDIAFGPAFRGSQFQTQSGRVFAQMKCCGTIREGVSSWVAEDKLSITSLEMWPGEWLLVVETQQHGRKIQATMDVVIQ
jgi:hypothetical protein